jgi:hypothetical protein
MTATRSLRLAFAALAVLALSPLPLLAQDHVLALKSARIIVTGTSNVHDYSASSDAVRLTGVQVSPAPDGDVFEAALQPGGLQAFAISIPVASLQSSKGDIDKNMHKALKAEAHPDITFALTRLEPAGTPNSYRAIGMLTIAGTSKEVPLAVTIERAESALSVSGAVPLVMTEFGVTPPKAMLGMLKTNPNVTVTFEAVVAR